MEHFLEFLSIILLCFLTIDLQTLPTSAMVLLGSKLEVLCEEFKNLEYHSERQFDESIAKVVNYHEYLLK